MGVAFRVRWPHWGIMIYLLLYFFIGTVLSLYGSIKKYRDFDLWSILLLVILWPLIVLVALMPDDLD